MRGTAGAAEEADPGSRGERVALLLSYDGSEFAGFQSQVNGRAVQDVVEAALRSLYRRDIRLAGASRTDSGVHAAGQVAVFDGRLTDPRIPLERLPGALNRVLPADVAILGAQAIGTIGFDPTHAVSKTYRYRILNRESPCPLRRRFVWHVRERLEPEVVHEEFRAVLGRHDFAAFCGAGSRVRTTIREILDCSVLTVGDELQVEMTGTGFLYHMVRSLVGTVVDVGLGRRPAGELGRVLASRNRSLAGPTAPPQGLCLTAVRYDPDLSGAWLGPISVDSVRRPTVH